MKHGWRIGGWMLVIGLLLATGRSTLAVNEVDDPNCSVVDVMQPNRLIDVNPGDEFWLTVPVESRITAVQVHREADKGWTWLKAGEFLPVQYNDVGEYTIRLHKANGIALPPFTVRVIGLPAETVPPGQQGKTGADGAQSMAAASGPSFSVGSVYAGDYVVGTNTVGKYPVRIVAKGIGDCRLSRYGGTNTWVWHFDLADFGTNALAEKSDVLDGPKTGQAAWTLVKSSGGTHVLSPNSPSKLHVEQLILTNDLGRAPGPGSNVANQVWFALTNEVVTLKVLPGPSWATNNAPAAASLFDWTTNNVALPVTVDLTQTFFPGVGTNLVNVACHSNHYPSNQVTTINGVAVEFVHAEGDEVGQPMRNLPIFTPNDGVGKGQPIYDAPTTELSVVLTGALSPGSVDSIAVTYLGVQYALMETGLNTLTFTNSAISVTLAEAPLADSNVQESMTARVTLPARGIADAVYECQETTAASLTFENDPTGLVMSLSDLTANTVDTIHLKGVNGFVREWDLTETAADSRCFVGSNMVLVVLEPSALTGQADTLLVSLSESSNQSNAVFRVRETGAQTKSFRNYNEPIPTDLTEATVPDFAPWQVRVNGLSDPAQLAGLVVITGIDTNDDLTFSTQGGVLLSDQKIILVAAGVNPADVPGDYRALHVDELQINWSDSEAQDVAAYLQFASATTLSTQSVLSQRRLSLNTTLDEPDVNGILAATGKAQLQGIVLQSLDCGWGGAGHWEGLDPEKKIKTKLEQMIKPVYADFNAKKQDTLTKYILGKQIWYSMSHGANSEGGLVTSRTNPGEFRGLSFLDGQINPDDISNLGLNYQLVMVDACCSAQTDVATEQQAREKETVIGDAKRLADAFGPKAAYVGWGWTTAPGKAQNYTSEFVQALRKTPGMQTGRTVLEARDFVRGQHANDAQSQLMKVAGETGTIIDK